MPPRRPARPGEYPTNDWLAMWPARWNICADCPAPTAGGRHAFLAASSLAFDAAVDCYGAFVVEDAPEGMPKTMVPILDKAPQLSCPLLGLFGIDDRFPSPDSVAALDAELTRLGKPHEFHSYEGAGHAFFSVDRPAYRVEAALDGWRHIDAFFATHLKG
jgi:carboxymethylenebutenolidase